MQKEYNHKQIEGKWQKFWFENNVFKSEIKSEKQKYYILDMFPYPSGAGLHVGHPEGYTATDILSRFKRMNGFNVLHPMGWDAFGLPAENYAIKTGTQPRISTDKNIQTFKKQIKSIGFSYDWGREIDTTDPNYYKWTQWIFLQLFEKGLAYEAEMPINWCPSCKTGLANEEVIDGKCDRCKNQVEKKEMKQWMLKITQYAERLLEDLDTLDDWPEPIKLMQSNWIGKSEGIEMEYPVENSDEKIVVYTKYPETNFGATFIVIAPEHPIVKRITSIEQKNAVEKYLKKVSSKSEIERMEEGKIKTGVFTGTYAHHRLTNRKLPIYVADFVLVHYGTGMVVAVPGHDHRDFEFAKKFDLEIIRVLVDSNGNDGEIESLDDVIENGKIINSEFLNGLSSTDAREKIKDYFEEQGWGNRVTNYKLRDWVFSRQRYWGEPIPIIHCEKCGKVGVPEEDLPVKLPEVEKYEPTGTGESPLAGITDWVNTKCPKCNSPAKRETNTMPQWAGSSWYYLRFMDNNNSNEFCSKQAQNYWGPIDMYVGGAEHAVLHLLYSRFWHKVLYDLGYVSTIEPFKSLRNQGMILASDGQKMSKSLGNVINPDDVIDEHGADTLRLYEMFMGPFDQAVSWDTKGILGVRRFLEKIWRLGGKINKPVKRVIVIHGFQGNGGEHWLPLLRHDLITKGYYVQVPSMPNSHEPKYAQWKEVLDFLKPDSNTTIVGHSLGGGFITRYLSDTGIKVGRVVLVAPTNSSNFVSKGDLNFDLENEEFLKQASSNIDQLFSAKVDLTSLKNQIGKVDLLYSNDEPFILQSDFEEYKDNLADNSKCIFNAGHCGEDSKEQVLAILTNEIFIDNILDVPLMKLLHKTIKTVGSHIEEFRFNTAISNMMILVNEFQKIGKIHANMFEDLLLILNPFAPHITEQIWQDLGHISSLIYKTWPYYNESLCKADELRIMIQVNGKLRGEIAIDKDLSKELVLKAAREEIAKYLLGKSSKKEIYVQGRIVNFVI